MSNDMRGFSAYEVKRKLDVLIKKQALLKKLELQYKKTKEDIRSIENDLSNAFPQSASQVVEG
jgi:cell wall assembly regulator SMI1